MRCASISGNMGFEDLDAAEERRRRREKMAARNRRADIPSAPPTPPVQPKTRLVESDEKPGVPFEPEAAPPVITPPSEGRPRRKRRDWEPPEIFETETASKYLPLPEELPPPVDDEGDIPDADLPEEERESAVELKDEAIVEMAAPKAAAPAPSSPAKLPAFFPAGSPQEEQVTGRSRVSGLGTNGNTTLPVIPIVSVLGAIAAIGVAVYYLKRES